MEADEFKKGQSIPDCELMIEWEKKDDTPMRLKYKVVLNGASAPKNFLRLVLDPAEGSKTLNSVIVVAVIMISLCCK